MDEAHERRADDLEREADRLEERGEKVEREIGEAREDWESKKKSEQVAGAASPEDAAPGGLGDGESDGAGDGDGGAGE
jgi:predicted  nucleic acid-binding Zn-ribbon protein